MTGELAPFHSLHRVVYQQQRGKEQIISYSKEEAQALTVEQIATVTNDQIASLYRDRRVSLLTQEQIDAANKRLAELRLNFRYKLGSNDTTWA